MNKSVLVNASIVCIILGILSVFYLSSVLKFEEQNYLSINGTVLSVVKRGKIFFVHFKPDDFQTISFRDVDLKKGQRIELKGSLKNYKGRMEFVIK